jgi:hypothetical protein
MKIYKKVPVMPTEGAFIITALNKARVPFTAKAARTGDAVKVQFNKIPDAEFTQNASFIEEYSEACFYIDEAAPTLYQAEQLRQNIIDALNSLEFVQQYLPLEINYLKLKEAKKQIEEFIEIAEAEREAQILNAEPEEPAEPIPEESPQE